MFIIKEYTPYGVSLDCIEKVFQCIWVLNNESRALFTGLTNTKFNKIFIKTGFYGTIHTFKNYFSIVFSVFSNSRYPNRPIYYHHIYMYKQLLFK